MRHTSVKLSFAIVNHERFEWLSAAIRKYKGEASVAIALTSIHDISNTQRTLADAEAIFIGGGNTFRLLKLASARNNELPNLVLGDVGHLEGGVVKSVLDRFHLRFDLSESRQECWGSVVPLNGYCIADVARFCLELEQLLFEFGSIALVSRCLSFCLRQIVPNSPEEYLCRILQRLWAEHALDDVSEQLIVEIGVFDGHVIWANGQPYVA
jgi:hypothetical protein